MIVNCRIELTDEQRNVLARMNKPGAPKRLATRSEVNNFVSGVVAALAASELEEPQPEPLAPFAPRRPNLTSLVSRARAEDAEALRGKSDGFVIGWCKVKYRKELQA